MIKAMERGWTPAPLPAPARGTPWALLALALWATVATVAMVGALSGWWPR